MAFEQDGRVTKVYSLLLTSKCRFGSKQYVFIMFKGQLNSWTLAIFRWSQGLKQGTNWLTLDCVQSTDLRIQSTVFVAARGLSVVVASGGYSSLRCAGFSLWWLLWLQSMGTRHAGFSSCGSRALECRLSSCGAGDKLLHGMWDIPGPGLEPVSPALAGRFLTTVPPGEPWLQLLSIVWCQFRIPSSSLLELFSFIIPLTYL